MLNKNIGSVYYILSSYDKYHTNYIQLSDLMFLLSSSLNISVPITKGSETKYVNYDDVYILYIYSIYINMLNLFQVQHKLSIV